MVDQLVRTRLQPPPLRPDLLLRPSLQARLAASLQSGHRLTVVQAPAGYGKTTALAHWARTNQALTAWLTLDTTDNQFDRFFRYLTMAWAAQQPPLLDSPLAMLVRGANPDPQALLTAFLNAAHALTAPEVVDAFLAVPGHYVALQIYEWSGRSQQSVRQDWVAIGSERDLAAVAARIRGLGRSHTEYPTALGFAMGFGARALETRRECWAHTLDISGDGTNNEGFSPDMARRVFPFEGVTVNGLVVGATRETLKRYYESYVISGPGAFVMSAVDYTDFERAMRMKLLRELGVGAVSALEPERR